MRKIFHGHFHYIPEYSRRFISCHRLHLRIVTLVYTAILVPISNTICISDPIRKFRPLHHHLRCIWFRNIVTMLLAERIDRFQQLPSPANATQADITIARRRPRPCDIAKWASELFQRLTHRWICPCSDSYSTMRNIKPQPTHQLVRSNNEEKSKDRIITTLIIESNSNLNCQPQEQLSAFGQVSLINQSSLESYPFIVWTPPSWMNNDSLRQRLE